MGSSLVGVDVVREGVDGFGIAVIPLQRDLRVDALAVALHVDRLFVDGALVLVQVLDERDDAAVVLELVALRFALVVERDENARVEKRQLAETLSERVEAELDGLEDVLVGTERDLGAALLRRPGCLDVGLRLPAMVLLLEDLPVAPDLEVELLRQRVDDRDADAVQSARHFVAVVVELAAGVQHRQHDFCSRAPALMLIGGNTPPVVDDRDRAVDMNRHVDLVAEPSQRLVNRVVDDFVDEMVQARRPGRADVHRRPLANGLEAFEDFDFVGAVILIYLIRGALLELDALVGICHSFFFAGLKASTTYVSADSWAFVPRATFGNTYVADLWRYIRSADLQVGFVRPSWA